jgi:alanine racemase
MNSKNSNSHNGLRTWIEIDRKAIKGNYDTFRSLIPKSCKLLAIVKSNAYGHSLIDFSKEAEKLGADFLGVDSIIEALALRREGIKTPILVLGYTLPEMISEAIKNDISITVSSLEMLKKITAVIGKNDKKLKIHIKVDTGMHRQGFLPEDSAKILANLQLTTNNKQLEVEGVFTHFASAKNPAFPVYTNHQIDDFKEWISLFNKNGFKPIVHAAATAGSLVFPDSHFDMVRIGIGLYGEWPSKESKAYLQDKMKLEPVLTWKTIISEIKNLLKGERLGYDLTEKLDRDSVVGICPVGYWHGIPRALSSVGYFLVNGKRAKILGRISMDMIVIDLTGIIGVKVTDEAVILGGSGKTKIISEEMAGMADTCNYELITRINPLIKRIYV